MKKVYGDLTIAVLRENEDLLLKIHSGDMDDLQDDLREIYQAVIGKVAVSMLAATGRVHRMQQKWWTL